MKLQNKFVVLVLFMLLTVPAFAQNYWQVVTPNQIKQMNQFERVQYSKALRYLNEGQYRAAATEFERFLIQYKEAAALPAIKFMQAYALHLAKDRNRAISVYNEVLDFFPDDVPVAAVALYYRGMAQIENGDINKGMASMKALMDDPDYSEQSVGASAALLLVDNYWKNKEPDKAAEYLKMIFENFRTKVPQVAEQARNYYVAGCLATGKTGEYENWFQMNYASEAKAKKMTPAGLRLWMVSLAYDLVFRNWHWVYNVNDLLQKYRGYAKKGGTDPGMEVWKLVEANRMNYEKENRLWEFYQKALDITGTRNYIKKEDVRKLAADMLKYVKTDVDDEKNPGRQWNRYMAAVNLFGSQKTLTDAEFDTLIANMLQVALSTPDDDKNKGRQQTRIGNVFRVLVNQGRLAQAAYVNQRITDERARSWNEYDLMLRQKQWDQALKMLDFLEKKFAATPGDANRIMWDRANILRDNFKKYDEAIKEYRRLSDPPQSLWAIVECHKRKGDSANVIKQLVEIENAFPDQGPRAAWTRAVYQRDNGNREMAVKEGRHIMKKYPKSAESSQAHQLLEQYGIDTGGAVSDL